MRLITAPNLARVDDVYEWLVEAHAGRSVEESARINARLILALVNHIGDEGVIREAIAVAAPSDDGSPLAPPSANGEARVGGASAPADAASLAASSAARKA